jgi:hypothetical protein
MDGDGPGGLIVVTGSPGAGKSALLGLLVCAAHPGLRGSTQHLWRAAADRPSENPELAAVHARQRTLPVILESLITQLHLEPGVAASELTPAPVIEAIARRARPPVIVVDAVDEALDHQQIVTQLLMPLARARREDGTPACRLLAGIRPWPEFASLLELAAQLGEIIDLDRIPVEQRRADVAGYVTSRLELLPGEHLDPSSAEVAQQAGHACAGVAGAGARLGHADPLHEVGAQCLVPALVRLGGRGEENSVPGAGCAVTCPVYQQRSASGWSPGAHVSFRGQPESPGQEPGNRICDLSPLASRISSTHGHSATTTLEYTPSEGAD